MATIYSFWISSKKYDREYDSIYSSIVKQDTLDNESLRLWQRQKMDAFLKEIVNTREFYRRRISSTLKSGETTDVMQLLKTLPILRKSEVRDNWEEIAKPGSISGMFKLTSSGTTGAALDVVLDKQAYVREYAFRWRYLSVGGAKRKSKFAYLLGNSLIPVAQKRPPYFIKDYYENSIHLSIFHLSERNIVHYVRAYTKYAPEYVKGYPSALYEFSRMVKKAGYSVPPAKAVYCASEVLHDYQRTLIEEVLGASIYQWYGQVETTINIHQCISGRLHVKETYGYLELLDENDNDVCPGETGRAVGTSWGNMAFPLLRYETGDMMTLALDQTCTCGMNGRIIERINGRDEDIIVTPDGRRLGRLDFLLKPIKSVEECQIVQEKIDLIRVLVVKASQYNAADEIEIRKMIKEYIGDDMNVEVEYCDRIPRDKSGKIRYVVSKIR